MTSEVDERARANIGVFLYQLDPDMTSEKTWNSSLEDFKKENLWYSTKPV